LSRLAHGRIFEAHHLDLCERVELGAQEDEEVSDAALNDTEEAGTEASQRSVEQREARVRQRTTLSARSETSPPNV